MTREIKFRGKRIDTGEWAVGSLIVTHKGFAGITSFTGKFPDGQIRAIIDEVDPATVGQCTGLKDKDGVNIYEEDIIRHGEEVFKILFGDGCFWRSNEDDTMELHTILGMGEFEVIGNIHDNPELLKGEDE